MHHHKDKRIQELSEKQGQPGRHIKPLAMGIPVKSERPKIERIKPLLWSTLDDKGRHKVAAFYNAYCDGETFDEIIKEQVSMIKDSGLIDKLDIVYYATMGKKGENYTIANDKFKHVTHYGDKGSEVQTLSLLHQFCAASTDSKVLYFHNKGSYHNDSNNAELRQVLDCFNLNPSCIDALDTHDTCGWRISPMPHPHYPGNFWWATCKYITSLVDPLSSANNDTFIDVSSTLTECIGSQTRHFAEAWVGSSPSLHPADCMSSEVDNSYLYGYYIPKNLTQKFCPWMHNNSATNHTDYGISCTTASVMVNLTHFSDVIDHIQRSFDLHGCNNYHDVIRRSYLWYGQKPTTYIEWMAPLRRPLNVSENELYRYSHGKQIYVVKNGTLHAIPNMQTMLAFNLDASKAKPVHWHHLNSIPKGVDLPSV